MIPYRQQLELERLPTFQGAIMIWPMSHFKDIRHGRHCVFAMHVHLVFVTKYRRCMLDGEAIEKFPHIFSKVCTDFEAGLVQMDGESDPVHLLVNYPPESVRLIAGQLLTGRFELRSTTPVASHHQLLLEQCTVVAFLLRRILWRRTARPHPTLPRAASDTAIVLAYPGVNSGACATRWSAN